MFITLIVLFASLAAEEGRRIPERVIYVPTSVSPEIQQSIAAPIGPRAKVLATVPKNIEEWQQIIEQHLKIGAEKVAILRKYFPVKEIENKTIAGVNVYIVTPETVSDENRNKVLINVHGGAFVFSGGEASLPEAILAAYYTKTKVICIDYRQPPSHPFPAALNDVVAVYRETLKEYKPANIGMIGTSSGANIISAAMFKLRDLKVPLPAALALGTPVCDLHKHGGDTRSTNEYIDNHLLTCDGLIAAAIELYAGGQDWKDPLLSPIYGDFSKGFPATIFTSGTRDLLLSDTVRMYTKLRESNIESKLQVLEGLSHAQYLSVPNAPESKFAFQEIALFFKDHL